MAGRTSGIADLQHDRAHSLSIFDARKARTKKRVVPVELEKTLHCSGMSQLRRIIAVTIRAEVVRIDEIGSDRNVVVLSNDLSSCSFHIVENFSLCA